MLTAAAAAAAVTTSGSRTQGMLEEIDLLQAAAGQVWKCGSVQHGTITICYSRGGAVYPTSATRCVEPHPEKAPRGYQQCNTIFGMLATCPSLHLPIPSFHFKLKMQSR